MSERSICIIDAGAAVIIYPGDRVEYKVAWWEGRNRRHEWLPSHEVEQAEGRQYASGARASNG